MGTWVIDVGGLNRSAPLETALPSRRVTFYPPPSPAPQHPLVFDDQINNEILAEKFLKRGRYYKTIIGRLALFTKACC
jgi:hypothetical protein